jgi:hypothetical protein
MGLFATLSIAVLCSVVTFNVVALSVIMLNVAMLNVAMLNVVAPAKISSLGPTLAHFPTIVSDSGLTFYNIGPWSNSSGGQTSTWAL